MPTIQRADPAARRLAVKILLAGLVLGLSCIAAFEYFMRDYEKWLEENIEFVLEHTYIFSLVSLVLVLPIAIASTYLLVFANRISRSGRFPPPGYAVTRDTVVLEGAAAQRRAVFIRILSIMILGTACAAPLLMWFIVEQVVGPA
jgi:hypothetical protein